MAIVKKFTSRIDIKATDVKLLGQVAQNDHFTNLFVIRLVDGVEPVDITGTDYVTVTYLLNGNSICEDATSERVVITDYENGELNIILPDGAVVYTGDIIATVELYEVNNGITYKLTSGRFAFRVVSDLSLTQGVNIEITEDQLSILQTIASNEALRQNAETNRRSAETGRSDAEALRVTAESARVLAEEGRVSAEGGRVLAEAGRVEAESARRGTISNLQSGLASVTSKVNNDIYTKTETDEQIDLKIIEIGAGDMTKGVYDTNDDGVVNSADVRANATRLGGELPSYYATRSDYVPTTRTVNGKALTSDISLVASDVSAVPTTRTVNGHALSSDVTVARDDITGIVKSNTTSSKTLTMSLSGTTLTITYQ